MRDIGQFYMLAEDGRTPVLCKDVSEWGRWLGGDREKRRVDHTIIGDVTVSTVFLGLDHNYEDSGPPILFETMIFGGEHSEDQERCSTWGDAQQMHRRAVELVNKKSKKGNKSGKTKGK